MPDRYQIGVILKMFVAIRFMQNAALLVSIVVMSAIIGLYWYRVAKARGQSIVWWQLLLVNSLLQIVFIACYLLTSHYDAAVFIKTNAITLFVLNPVVAALCGKVFNSYLKTQVVEQKTIEQESYFHNIYDRLKVGIYHTDKQGRYLEMNQAMAQLLGFDSPQKAIDYQAKTSDEDLLGVDYLQQILEVLSRDGEIHDFRLTFTNTRDEQKMVNISAWVIPASSQGQIVYEGIASDITELMETQNRLQVSEDKYRSYVQHSPLGVYEWNRNLQYIEVNNAACAMTGHSKEELLNMTVWQVIDPKDMNIVLKGKEDLFNRGYATFTARCITKSGNIIQCRVDAVMLSDDRILGIVTDMTEMLLTRQELDAQQEAIIKLVDSTKAGFWDWDLVNQIVYLSPGLKTMLGYGDEETPEGVELWQKIVFEEDDPENMEPLNRHFDSHGVEPYHYRLRLKHKDGHAVWGINSGYVLEWQDEGRPGRMVGIFVDASAMKAMEEEVVQLNQQLEQQLSDISQLDRDTSELEFTDLFNLNEIQAVQDSFALSSGVASIIVDLQGHHITHPSNYSMLCRDVISGTAKGRENCLSVCDLMGTVSTEGPLVRHCLNGCMFEGSVSIIVEGRHIANWMYGQVLDEDADTDVLLQYAQTIGADELQFAQALPLVTRMNRVQFESMGQALQAIVDQLTQQAVQNAQQVLANKDYWRVEKALRLSEARYQQLLDEMTSGFISAEVILDGQGKPVDYRFLQINRKGEAMFGASAEQVIGKTATEVFPQLENRWVQQFCQVGMTGETAEFEGFYALSGQCFNVFAYRPEPMKFAVMFRDISDRIKAEQEHKLFQQRIDQSQKMEGLGVLAGGIAHDFNNILMAIMGHADVALLGLPSPSSSSHSIDEIKKSVSRGSELCRQMLTYSGNATYIVQPVDLHALVMEMVELSRASVSKKIHFHLHLPSDTPSIMGDDAQVRQVVMNLIVNASEAIGNQNGTISLSIKQQSCSAEQLAGTAITDGVLPGDYLVLGITDNGCGMDEHMLVRMFEPFYTTKFTGRGLGMSSVLSIVKGHKGTISVRSEVGKGSTIEVYFPLSVNQAPAVTKLEPAVLNSWRGEGTVLLVDDEVVIRDVGRQMLIHIGYTVLTASDGREALEVYRDSQAQISVVLLDMSMPDLDGVDTFRALRRINPLVKVLISSGYAEKDVEQKFKDEAVTGFIAKPYTLTVLREQLYHYLREG